MSSMTCSKHCAKVWRSFKRLALVVVGIVATVLAEISQWLTFRRLRRNEALTLPRWRLSITEAMLLVIIGSVSLWCVFLR